MADQPSPVEQLRTELARRGMTPTVEGRERARAQLAEVRAAWPADRFEALRERTRRAARRMFGHPHTPAA